MFNRVMVHRASGSGGAGRAHVGMASGQSGMKCRLHNTNCGSGSTENSFNPGDYLKITSISQDIVTAISASGSKTYTEYSFFTSIPDNDDILTATGAVNYYAGTVASGHYPYR